MSTKHPHGNEADDSVPPAPRNEGGIKKGHPAPPDKGSLIEQAETRTEKAETQTGMLRASELSYRRLFESARDGILILDADTGHIADVNPFLVELLGYSHGEMVWKTVGELSPFKDILSNQAMLERLQKDGYIRYEDLPLETRDGRRIPVEFVSNVYQAGDKKVIQCNIRDITGRKQAEEALRQRMEELTQFNAAAVGRELRMIEMKQQVNELARQLGQPPPYDLEGLTEAVPGSPQAPGHGITEPKSPR